MMHSDKSIAQDEVKPGYFRVSEILWFVSGLTDIDPEIIRRAAERGGKVHLHCDALIEGFGLKQMDEDVKGYVESALQWIETKKFVNKPKRFYCDKYKITGEIDGLYETQEDGITLFDFKTSQKESKTWPLQLSAYAYLARETGIAIEKIEIIHLSKKGHYPKVLPYKEDLELFLKCLEIYRHFGIKKRAP